MSILLLLIPISLLLLTVAISFLVWGIKSGQYDDLDSPAHRILFDEDESLIPPDARTPEQHKKAAQHKEAAQREKTTKPNAALPTEAHTRTESDE
ncbi:cbb3-type cytochrome oxidase assembly protein CcoS [Salinispirillum marinum]|uniref:Cbb3-type cytochrome oxidase assembly protein CcoS n=2 Tax=Saccharospirillaceae TaxID=255527 RepID=A0ABV8BBQ5_9GAMM